MKEKGISLFLKGIVIGIANMIAGISGGTLAFIMGIYQNMVTAFANLTKKFWPNFLYLLKICLGVAVGVLLCSLLLDHLFDSFLFETVSFFVGVLIGGLINDAPSLKLEKEKKKSKYIIGMVIAGVIVIGLAFVNIFFAKEGIDSNERWRNVTLYQMGFLFLAIIIGAVAMIFPGISGSMLFMIMGIYYPVLNAFSDLLHFSMYSNPGFIFDELKIMIPLVLGGALSLIFISKPIKTLLERHYKMCLYVIFGFVIGSIISIYIINFSDIENQFSILHLCLSLFVTLPIGCFCSIGLHKISQKMKTKKPTDSEDIKKS